MSLKKNYIYNTINQLLTMLVSIVTVPYISRVLGATNIGIYSYTYSIVSYFIMFVTLGLNNYGNREIAKCRDKRLELNTTFSEIYCMQICCGIFVLVVYFIYIVFLAKQYFFIFLIQTIYIFSSIIDINWAMYGMEEFKFTAIRNSVLTLLNFFLIILFVRNKDSLTAYTFILAFGVFLNQLVSWFYVIKKISFIKPSYTGVIKHIKPNLILFIPIVAVSLYKVMDKIMLGNLTSMRQVGFYESSEKIIRIPTILISSLGTVMLPRMTNLYANDDGKKITTYISKSIDIAMILSSSLCFGIMAVSKEFIPIFYGPGYEICIYIYLVLLPSCLFLAFSNVIRTQYLIPTGREKIFIRSVILGAFVNLIINYLLIPEMQSIGAAIGTLIAEMTVCISQSFEIRHLIPIKEYIKRSIPFIILGIIMFVFIFNIELPCERFIALLLKIILGILVYLLGLIIIFIKGKNLYNIKA